MSTRQEILENLRSKYPAYRDIDDGTLAQALAKKHPEYIPALLNGSSERAESVEGNLQRNEELRQQNIESGLSAVPLHGFKDAYKEGLKSGRQLLGDNLAGDILGGLTGTGGAIGTIFNPITKAASNIPRLTQAGGERFIAGDTARAGELMTGERDVEPAVTFNENTGSTIRNLAASAGNTIQTEPINSALALEGARNPAKTYRGAVEGATKLADRAGLGDLARTDITDLKGIAEGIQEASGTNATKVPDSVKRLGSRLSNLKESPADLLSYVTGKKGTSGEDVILREKIQRGDFGEDLADLAANKDGYGKDGLVKANEALNRQSIPLIKEQLRAANPKSPLFNRESNLARIDEILSSSDPKVSIALESERASAIKGAAEKYLGSVNPSNLMQYISEIDGKLSKYYSSTDQSRVINKTKALEATRRVLSDTVKTIIDESGGDPAEWTKYGRRNELVRTISDFYGKASEDYRFKRGEGLTGSSGVGPSDILGKIPLIGPAKEAISRFSERVTGGTPARIDSKIESLFKKTKPSETKITPEAREQMINDAIQERMLNQEYQRRAEANRAKNQSQSDLKDQLIQKKLARDAEIAKYAATPEEMSGEAVNLVNEAEADFLNKMRSQQFADELRKSAEQAFTRESERSKRAR